MAKPKDSMSMNEIRSTVKLEMEYYKLIGKTPHIPLLLGDGEDQEKKKAA